MYKFVYKPSNVNKAQTIKAWATTQEYLYKTPEPMPDAVFSYSALIVGNPVVIYLETVKNSRGVSFHKLLVNDQIGYVNADRDSYRLKRITSRMLRRMGSSDLSEAEVP